MIDEDFVLTPAAELRALDAELQGAVLRQDVNTLDRLLAEDWILVASTGRVIGRQEFLRWAGDPACRLEVNEPSEAQVRVHGTTGIVSAVLHERGSNGGRPHEAWLRYTDTWVLEGGAWRYLAGHACRIAAPDRG